MVTKKIAKTTAATFGAAMASMFVAPQLDADIIDLTFSPGSVAYGATYLTPVAINELGSGFAQWNDSIGATVNYGSLNGGVALAAASDSVAAGFLGYANVGFTASQSGTYYIAFGLNGNAGWFSFNKTAFGAVTYIDGEYGSMGETVTVGGTNAIPEPTGFGALAALAMGAAGVRRNRKKQAA